MTNLPRFRNAKWVLACLSVALCTGQAFADPQLILLVDGYADGVIYNTRRHKGGGTNVDDLTPILRTLDEVVVGAELVHPAWQRHDEVRRMHARLIIIHLSAFRGGSRDTEASVDMLKGLLKAIGPTNTRVIIYSRRVGLETDSQLHRQLFDILGRKGRIADHLRFLEIKGWTKNQFPVPETAESLRTLAREFLSSAEGSQEREASRDN